MTPVPNTLVPDPRTHAIELSLTAASAEETRALAARLGQIMQAGDVIALIGPLGSGKTTFAQGLALGLGVPADRHVASPTFALVNEHPGRVPFLHADLYRIKDPAELGELGLDEAFDRTAAALEWADRFPDALPGDRLTIQLLPQPDGGRHLRCKAQGIRSVALLEALRSAALPRP
jgi:tRNA threonylcarbamoyladenosine biosynthesis protein TsaE